ncbi:MAG: FHA domain-containing protein, partial [Cyanobacteria bacterium P01_A01_bin.70]
QVDDGWEIVNLGTNGTYLEGKRVAQAPAEDGIVIRLARSGPNIQINIKQEGTDSVRALRKLRDGVVTRTKAASPSVGSEDKTDIHSTNFDES